MDDDLDVCGVSLGTTGPAKVGSPTVVLVLMFCISIEFRLLLMCSHSLSISSIAGQECESSEEASNHDQYQHKGGYKQTHKSARMFLSICSGPSEKIAKTKMQWWSFQQGYGFLTSEMLICMCCKIVFPLVVAIYETRPRLMQIAVTSCFQICGLSNGQNDTTQSHMLVVFIAPLEPWTCARSSQEAHAQKVQWNRSWLSWTQMKLHICVSR